MISKKIKALSLVLAASIMAALPVSAYNFDVSNPEKTIDVRVNKPYFNFNVKAGEDVNINGMRFIISDSTGKKVATVDKNGMKLLDNDLVDFSDIHSVEDYTNAHFDTFDMFDVFKADKTKGCEPSGYMYNAAGGGCIDGLGGYYIRPTDQYYYIYSNKAKFNIVATMTVPANKIFVDVSSKFIDIKDQTTYFRLRPETSPSQKADYINTDCKMYDNAGKSFFINADTGEYHVCVNGGVAGGNSCYAYNRPTTYSKIRIKFTEAIPGFCDDSLTFDEEFFGKNYHFDMRGDSSVNCFSALYYSGAAISAPIPDADGYIEIWVSDEKLQAFMEYDYSFGSGGGGGSVYEVYLPKSVEKINSIFEYPQKGFCIYNIAPETYTIKIENPADDRDYYIVNNTVTVTDTKELQKTEFVVKKRPLLLGDCNRDRKINSVDIVTVASHIRGIKKLDGRGPISADVDESGRINLADIAKIAAHIRGVQMLPHKYV